MPSLHVNGGLQMEYGLAPELIQALSDKRWRKRAQAVEALGRAGDKRALPYLVRALNDRKSGVRMVAAEALAQLGDKRAVPHLAQALYSNKGRVLPKIGWALGRLGALSELVRALDDRRWHVREAAVVGLGEVGKKAEAITLLGQYLERDPEHGRELVYKLVKLSEGSTSALARLIETALVDRRDILYFAEVQKRREKRGR